MLSFVVPLQAGSGFAGNQLVLMAILVGIFYVIVVRPMRKKQREVETMLSQLKNGDRVLTTGGIYGTVVGVTDEFVHLRVADHVKIQVAKSSITQLVEEPKHA